MSEIKRKILLVENQWFQFEEIAKLKCLKSYEIIPSKDDYITLIDNVRVWVNTEYNKEYRDVAIKFVKDFISNSNIELIIMDHILGGAFHCLTGVDLAVEINSNINIDKCMPILFLSKTEQSEKNRMTKYENYKKIYSEDIYTKWIHKGYFGDEILSEEYFEKMVIPEIHKLFASSEENKFWIKFDIVKSLVFPPNQNVKKSELFRIRENLKYCNLPQNLKVNVERVFTTKNINELTLKILEDAK